MNLKIKFNKRWDMNYECKSAFYFIDKNNKKFYHGDENTRFYMFKGTNLYRRLNYAFKDCEELEEIEIAGLQGCQSATGMFSGCINLKKVIFSGPWTDSIDSIGEMFYGCTSLEEIILPESWNNIEYAYGMFGDCINLKKVVIPKEWNTLKDATCMFAGCSSLCNYTGPREARRRLNFRFNYFGQHTLIEGMFKDCTGFTSIEPGVKIDTNYYMSAFDGSFPEECYKIMFMLNLPIPYNRYA